MYFEKNSHYGKQTFWEKRYAEYPLAYHRNCTEFDWYQNWANLRDIVSQYIKRDSKILNVGAGTPWQTQAIRPSARRCTPTATRISPISTSQR
jgi:hypothetical protein